MSRPSRQELCALRAQLERVRSIHDQVRDKLYPLPCDAAHFVNENTVVRIAAAFEAYNCQPDIAWGLPSKGRPEVCTRAVFFLRNVILHEAGGYLLSRKIHKYEERKHVYEALCHLVPDARVKEGERLKLGGEEVLTPLFQGCIEYLNSQLKELSRSKD